MEAKKRAKCEVVSVRIFTTETISIKYGNELCIKIVEVGGTSSPTSI
jgi:hypothetical protein